MGHVGWDTTLNEHVNEFSVRLFLRSNKGPEEQQVLLKAHCQLFKLAADAFFSEGHKVLPTISIAVLLCRRGYNGQRGRLLLTTSIASTHFVCAL